MDGPHSRTATQNPIGLIAGGGALPAEVASSIVRRGGRVHVIDVNGAADAAVHAYPRTVVQWSKLGAATRALKTAGVRDVVMLGTFARPELSKARPDFAFLRELPAIIRLLRAGGDDALLRCLIAIFERQGLRVVGVGDAAPDLLAPDGNLSACAPTVEDERDIRLGFALIDALGQYDIGQAAVVAGGRVVAIEAAEGTDRMLARLAEHRTHATAGERSGVLVKRPKPSQDVRADLPAIGPGTVRNANAAGLAGVAVMSGKVLIAERPKLIAEADAAGLFVAGRVATADRDLPLLSIITPRQLGRIAMPDELRGDIVRGIRVMRELRAFGTGSAAVVRGARVLALGASDSAFDVIARANGHMRGRRSRAVIVLAEATDVTASLIESADVAQYAGIVVLTADTSTDLPASIVAVADRQRQFIVRVSAEPEDTRHV